MDTIQSNGVAKADTRKPVPIIEVQQALTRWYDLRFNEISHMVEGRKKGDKQYLVLNENNLFIQLLENGYRISFGNLCALLNSEFVEPYNPFKTYFSSLPTWSENEQDYINELANFVKAKDQFQFNHHFKKMLVRTVSCAIDDHFFNKHAFILVGGEQNTGKSTFCRHLCPTPLRNYFTENIPGDKDGLISLCENFMINLDELSTLSKFELNHLKSLFSKDRVRVRHPFARKSQTDPRRATFIGSTNEDVFLTDTTGSVRWLCFDIHSIDWNYDKMDIDLVWSQAFALYNSGYKCQLTPDEIAENESRNEQYQQVTMEYEYIQLYLSPGTATESDLFATTTEIRDYIISKSDRKADIKNLDRLGKALKQLGFVRLNKRTGLFHTPTWGYYVKYAD